jgi:hypothetical protein
MGGSADDASHLSGAQFAALYFSNQLEPENDYSAPTQGTCDRFVKSVSHA